MYICVNMWNVCVITSFLRGWPVMRNALKTHIICHGEKELFNSIYYTSVLMMCEFEMIWYDTGWFTQRMYFVKLTAVKKNWGRPVQTSMLWNSGMYCVDVFIWYYFIVHVYITSKSLPNMQWNGFTCMC